LEGSARDEYLLTAIRTAGPAKLHLMLVEAAIRWCNRAQQRFRAGQAEVALECLFRAEEVVTQLLADLNPETEPARNLAGVYLFVFRTLGAAVKNHDPEPLDDVLRILQIEHETWRLVCAKFSGAEGKAADHAAASAALPARRVPPPLSGRMTSATSDSGFSVEA
jgi:flagellar protein FliS